MNPIEHGNDGTAGPSGTEAHQAGSSVLDGEGYLLLATGPAQYVEMARNLAASLRIMDATRPICLVHDEDFEPGPGDDRLFDDYSLLPNDPAYPGFMNKIRLFGRTPYSRSMFVDADCLLMKRDVDTWWQVACSQPFAIPGTPRREGEWKGSDIGTLLRQEGAPYLVQMNSGVFSFDRSPAAARFFAGLVDFYERRHHALAVGLHRGRFAQTDEIYLGLWMGLSGIFPVISRIGHDTWMNSTWRAFRYELSATQGTSMLRKPTRSIAGIPNPLFGWDTLSPSFVHFVGLKPARHYQKLASQFRAAAARLPPKCRVEGRYPWTDRPAEMSQHV